jgi:hypothetical protein
MYSTILYRRNNESFWRDFRACHCAKHSDKSVEEKYTLLKRKFYGIIFIILSKVIYIHCSPAYCYTGY